jgi:NtrC-family two-component system sensor histidine kinase KinB
VNFQYRVDRKQGNRFPSLLSSYCVGVVLASAFLLFGFFQPPSRLDIPLFLSCLASFILADILYGEPRGFLLLGYVNFGFLLAWLIIGSIPAFVVILLGTVITALLRLIWGKQLQQSLTGRRRIFEFALWRAAVSSATLVAASLCFLVFSVNTPLNSVRNNILPLAIALLIAGGISQLLGLLLLGDKDLKPFWAASTKNLVMSEGLISLLIPLMPALLNQVGEIVFLLGMAAVALQAVLYKETLETRRQLTQRIEELSLLQSLRQRIADTLIMDDLLWNIYEEVQKSIPSKVFIAALYDEDSSVIDFRLVVEEGQIVQKHTRLLHNSPIDEVIRKKQPVNVSIASDERQGTNFTDDSTRFAAYLAVPLMVGDRIIGALACIEQRRGSFFNHRDTEVLQTIASQVALAIRNAVLFYRSTKLTESLALINGSVQNVMFNLDSVKGMEIACDTAMQITGAQKAAIFLLDINNKKEMRLVQHVGLPQAFVQAHQTIEYNPERYYDGAYVVTKVSDNPEVTQQAELGRFRAFAQTPLRSSSTIIGFIAVYHDLPHFYRKSELDLLETLANQITAALDNAELLKALEIYASEQAQLVYLSRMSGSSLELDKVLMGIATLLEQMLNIDHVQIGVLVPGKDRLQLFHAHGDDISFQTLPLSALPEIQSSADAGQIIAPQIFQSNHPNLSPALQSIMMQYKQASVALTPLFVNNNLLGVVILGSQQTRDFSDSEARLIEMAMNQIAAQIYNARLYTTTEDDLQQRLEQLSLLENIAQQITGALDLNQLISYVLQAAITSTQADVATLGLLTEGDDFWFIVREHDEHGVWHQHYVTSTRSKGISGRVARTGQSVLITDNRLDPDYIPPLEPVKQEYLSSLVVPLRKEDRIVGVLNVESTILDFFTSEQLSFLHNVAGHAVISIDNARLMQERQQEIETLTRLRELSLRMSSAPDIPSVATAILQTSFSMLNAQDAAIFSYNELTDDVTLLAGIRYDSLHRVELNETLVRGKFAYQIFHNHGSDYIEDLRKFPPYEFVDTRDYITMLGVPIKRNRRVTEVLCLAFNTLQRFEEREQSAIDLLSIQAAGHLENAMLNETIRSNSNRMRAILDSTRDGVILLDTHGLLIDFNPSAERLLGITLEDRANLRFAETLMSQAQAGELGEGGYSEAEIGDLVRILQEEPDRITRRQFARFVHGQFTHIEEIGSPVTDLNHSIMGRLLVLRDVSEEKMLEAYREDITHMIVHDLRAPLGSIISALTLAMESINDPSTNYMVGTTLDVSLASAYKLLRLVDSLLDIAKLEKRQMLMKFAPAKMSMMVNESHKTLTSSVSAANITIEIKVAEDLPDVYVDSDKIQRVLVNLLDNAIRYTPTNGTILLQAQVMENRKKMLVQIADSGSGIPPEERERVFDKFTTQVKKGPLRGPKGSGLGLTFCKLAIEAHGERIWVDEKSPLSGACFSFTLPLTMDSLPLLVTDTEDELSPVDIIE